MTSIAPEAVTEVSEELEPREPEHSESALVPASEHYLRIEPSKGWVSLKLRELWEYRELLYFLTWRDIKVRYKQTVLGAV